MKTANLFSGQIIETQLVTSLEQASAAENESAMQKLNDEYKSLEEYCAGLEDEIDILESTANNRSKGMN